MPISNCEHMLSKPVTTFANMCHGFVTAELPYQMPEQMYLCVRVDVFDAPRYGRIYARLHFRRCVRTSVRMPVWIHGGFPKWGYPQIIHFQMGFSIITQPYWGTPIYGTRHMSEHMIKQYFRQYKIGNTKDNTSNNMPCNVSDHV